MIKGAKDFLAVKFNRNLVIALAVLGFLLLAFEQAQMPVATAQTSGAACTENLTVHFFYLPTCPHCAAQEPFNEELMRQYPQVAWVQHDISKTSEAQVMSQMMQDYGLPGDSLHVPMTFVGNNYILGYDSKTTTGVQLSAMLADYVARNPQASGNATAANESKFTFDIPFVGKTDLRSMSLPALSVILGLVDGFNPCAMWMLVYLIALVMELNNRKRIWLIVGTFLFASGALYFLFMTAWLNLFLLVGYLRPVMIIIGLVAFGSGILAVREYLQTRGRPVCKIEDEEDKSKKANRMQQIIASPLTISTMLAIVGLAFAVNAVEFMCSAGIPAVFTQVLALSNLSGLEHYGYILLYDVFYMLDDIIIFCVAAFALSSTDFTERYAGFSKIVGGAILLVLGFLMLFAPGLLR
jgi:glutaredoxin